MLYIGEKFRNQKLIHSMQPTMEVRESQQQGRKLWIGYKRCTIYMLPDSCCITISIENANLCRIVSMKISQLWLHILHFQWHQIYDLFLCCIDAMVWRNKRHLHLQYFVCVYIVCYIRLSLQSRLVTKVFEH
jgi:hypothetical protein